ncbi:hypothetical protein RSOLAG22IIIB_06044 [Rhizoctonia solani]|uniref:Uncharacterized protein n=1 Tax=Rhizoctonia solani TaxID=456999 RepID=A0A0K6GAS9_9AGAM|nr:hypothetical protein RSOLAG22IIIB_06044 [Rhizoctonia solani]
MSHTNPPAPASDSTPAPAKPQRRSWLGSLRAGSAAPPQSGLYQSWEQHIPWDGLIRSRMDQSYKHLPEVEKLDELIKQSRAVPAWLTKSNSPQCERYCNHLRRLGLLVEALTWNVSRSDYNTNSTDDELSIDIEERYRLGLEPVEADVRHPMHSLGTLIWELQSNGLSLYRTQRKLQIPPSTDQHSSYTKPDACTFIPIFNGPASVAPTYFRPALSCLTRTGSADPDCDYIVHWVTELKCQLSEQASKRQVVKGLVSALYQRRALGFPNHFVFGTAHHNQTILEGIMSPAGPANDLPGNLLRADDIASSEPVADVAVTNPNLKTRVENIKKHNKIVVYTIATYSMSDINDLFQLYLLMRHARTLAQRYQKEIQDDTPDLIWQLLDEAKDIYEWPPPPLPLSKRETAKQRKLDELESSVDSEETEDMMSLDSNDDSDFGSDSE